MKTKSPAQRPSIVAWPADERPRERLLARGPEALIDAERLATFCAPAWTAEKNITKNEYVLAHFAKLNEHLAAEGSPVRYQFNFLSPASFNAFFQALSNGNLAGFRSELDVRLGEVG